MTLFNESGADRGVRAIGGLALLLLGWVVPSESFRIVLFVLGAMALGTGLVGWCPAYSLLAFSTVKKPAARCPHCEGGHGTS